MARSLQVVMVKLSETRNYVVFESEERRQALDRVYVENNSYALLGRPEKLIVTLEETA